MSFGFSKINDYYFDVALNRFTLTHDSQTILGEERLD